MCEYVWVWRWNEVNLCTLYTKKCVEVSQLVLTLMMMASVSAHWPSEGLQFKHMILLDTLRVCHIFISWFLQLQYGFKNYCL